MNRLRCLDGINLPGIAVNHIQGLGKMMAIVTDCTY